MTLTETDLDRAIAAAAQCVMDASLEHDEPHCARACAELRRLAPEQRDSDGE